MSSDFDRHGTRCLWCEEPTDERLGGGTGARIREHPEQAVEPWHWVCWAERQAWEYARAAGLTDDDDEASTSVAVGTLWIRIARQMRTRGAGGTPGIAATGPATRASPLVTRMIRYCISMRRGE